jgi:hypothetical protein
MHSNIEYFVSACHRSVQNRTVINTPLLFKISSVMDWCCRGNESMKLRVWGPDRSNDPVKPFFVLISKHQPMDKAHVMLIC